MLQSLHVDNYKCLVNFDLAPTNCQPIFGGNGTGKSSVFEVLKSIQLFVFGGVEARTVFPTRTLTRWDTRDVQAFELGVEGNGGVYQYDLRIEHDRRQWTSRIARESLTFQGQPLYSFANREAQLFVDGGAKLGSPVPLDASRSGLSLIQPTHVSSQLAWFKRWMGQIVFLDVQPRAMQSDTKEEWYLLLDGAVNFASWYRDMAQQRLSAVVKANQRLSDSIDGFSSMSLVPAGERTRLLKVEFRAPASSGRLAQAFSLDFDELSDGQRTLIVLYHVLAFLEGTDRLLCLDEPANFVALAEIQPFLSELSDAIGGGPAQCLLVSHHPEVINYMASETAVILEREAGGPVRVRPFAATDGSLSAAELIARGWEHE